MRALSVYTNSSGQTVKQNQSTILNVKSLMKLTYRNIFIKSIGWHLPYICQSSTHDLIFSKENESLHYLDRFSIVKKTCTITTTMQYISLKN